MLNVYLTIDVEVWSSGWKCDSESLQQAYQKYIVGRTRKGDFGLAYQLGVINSANLAAVCFVEPLFSKVAGDNYLSDIINICRSGNNDIQLHAHPEWLRYGFGDFRQIDFDGRYVLSQFNFEEQLLIIAEAKRLLERHTKQAVGAFRAGGFSANLTTLKALHQLGIAIDSSFNFSMPVLRHGFVHHPTCPNSVFKQHGVLEYPMTVYRTHNNTLRHAQLAACTFQELKKLLEQAYATKQRDFVILSHSVEMLDGARRSVDRGILSTFLRLIDFLHHQPEKYACKVFSEHNVDSVPYSSVAELTRLHAGYTLHRVLRKVIHRGFRI